jgi:hypothetical protein
MRLANNADLIGDKLMNKTKIPDFKYELNGSVFFESVSSIFKDIPYVIQKFNPPLGDEPELPSNEFAIYHVATQLISYKDISDDTDKDILSYWAYGSFLKSSNNSLSKYIGRFIIRLIVDGKIKYDKNNHENLIEIHLYRLNEQEEIFFSKKLKEYNLPLDSLNKYNDNYIKSIIYFFEKNPDYDTYLDNL